MGAKRHDPRRIDAERRRVQAPVIEVVRRLEAIAVVAVPEVISFTIVGLSTWVTLEDSTSPGTLLSTNPVPGVKLFQLQSSSRSFNTLKLTRVLSVITASRRRTWFVRPCSGVRSNAEFDVHS